MDERVLPNTTSPPADDSPPAQTAPTVEEVGQLEEIDPAVAQLLDQFIDAGGTAQLLVDIAAQRVGPEQLDELWQTGRIGETVYRDDMLYRPGQYPDAGAVVNYANANFANANTADKSNTPLERGELTIMRIHLETLAKGGTLKTAQEAELRGYLARFNKFPPKIETEQQLEQLQKLLGALDKITGKGGASPAVGWVFTYFDEMFGVLTDKLAIIKDGWYAKFKSMMDNKPGDVTEQQHFDDNKGAFPEELQQKMWLQYQIEKLKGRVTPK